MANIPGLSPHLFIATPVSLAVPAPATLPLAASGMLLAFAAGLRRRRG